MRADVSANHVGRTRSRGAVGLGVLWALALLGWIALLGIEWFFTGPTACPLTPSSSIYGTAEWSWLPPGRTCTWQLPEGTHTDAPSPARAGIALLFVLWGASLLLLRRGRSAA